MTFSTDPLHQVVSTLVKPDGVIAFATDTVYGLACLAQHPRAVARIYQIKGRAETKPLILMSDSVERLMPFVGDMSQAQQQAFMALSCRYWPGPLTLVVPKNPTSVPTQLTQGHSTVGLRVPNIPILSRLCTLIPGGVLATTSANRSGQPDCLTADCVQDALGGQIDAILADDLLVTGAPSTVVLIHPDATHSVLRQGLLVLD